MERHPGTPHTTYVTNNMVYEENRLGLDKYVHPDTAEEYRQGYRCMRCDEPFGAEFEQPAWPERCNVCGFGVREYQAAEFIREYAGQIVNLENIVEDDVEQDNWRKRDGVFLPVGFEQGAGKE